MSRILTETGDKRDRKTRNESSASSGDFESIKSVSVAVSTGRLLRSPHLTPLFPVCSQWLAPRMNRWDQYFSRNHQTGLISLMEPELSSNARPEETPNLISFGSELTEVLWGMFLDCDRYVVAFSLDKLHMATIVFAQLTKSADLCRTKDPTSSLHRD